jgi:hypothetical protein
VLITSNFSCANSNSLLHHFARLVGTDSMMTVSTSYEPVYATYRIATFVLSSIEIRDIYFREAARIHCTVAHGTLARRRPRHQHCTPTNHRVPGSTIPDEQVKIRRVAPYDAAWESRAFLQQTISFHRQEQMPTGSCKQH